MAGARGLSLPKTFASESKDARAAVKLSPPTQKPVLPSRTLSGVSARTRAPPDRSSADQGCERRSQRVGVGSHAGLLEDASPLGTTIWGAAQFSDRTGYRSRHRLRKQTAEPVIGNIKDRNGLRQFFLRGLAKAAGELSLACTAHNLLKLASARA